MLDPLNTVNQNTQGAIVVADWEEFKRMSRDFCVGSKTMNYQELQNAHKCLALAYLSFEQPDTMIGNMHRENSAPIIMKLATSAFLKREQELLV